METAEETHVYTQDTAARFRGALEQESLMTSPFITSQFAHNPSAALQCYADIQATVRRWDADTYRNPAIDALVMPDDVPKIVRGIRSLYTECDDPPSIYWWPSRIAAQVSEAAAIYPLSDESIEWDVQGAHFVFVFQQPIRLLLGGADRPNVSAISYSQTNGWLFVYPWVWNGADSQLIGPLIAWTAQEFVQLPAFAVAQIQWLYTATKFADQRIIGQSTHVVNRKVRERVIGHVPNVNVVHLRPYAQEPRGDTPSDRHIDFECRFWVRKHKRHLKGHDEPIVIPTYLKGPADKPIKERDTVFAVTR